jgi:hypothetical protein
VPCVPASRLPKWRFLHHLDCSFLARRSFSPQRDWLLVTAFPSPATAPSFEGSIPGSTFPACYFASCSAAPKPVRLSAPPPLPVRPVCGSFFALARCLFAASLDRLSRRPPLPFRSFASLGIKAFCRINADQSTFRLRPISSRSPLPFSITSCGSGSSFQVRYVSGGLLFLGALRTAQRCAALPAVKPYLRTNRFQGDGPSRRKENSSGTGET